MPAPHNPTWTDRCLLNVTVGGGYYPDFRAQLVR